MLATVVGTLRDLDDPTLTEELRRLELERRRIEAEMAAIVAEGQRRSIHVVDHHHSMTGWLKANANYSGTQCSRLRRLARLVDDLGEVGDALHAGRIGTAQADELPGCMPTHAAVISSATRSRSCWNRPSNSASTTPEHVCVGGRCSPTSMARTPTGGERRAPPSHGRRSRRRAASASLGRRRRGDRRDVAIFNAEVERQFRADVAERTRPHGPDAPASLLPRTDAQRRYDALQAIFRKAVTAPVDGRLPTSLVNIIVDRRTHEEGLANHGFVPFPDDPPTSTSRSAAARPTAASRCSPTTSCGHRCKATSDGS